MLVKVWSAAVLVAATVASGAAAQSVADIGGPREMPPASYGQQQYIDSRGCAFVRAGIGGQVRWVPRVGDDRRVICGLPPSLAPRARVEVAEESTSAAPAPVRTATAATRPAAPAPAPTAVPPRPAASARVPVEAYAPAPVANLPAIRPAPAAPPVPATRLADTGIERTGSGVTGRRIACTSSAPVAERVALRGGGSVVVCTRGDGTLDGWRSPVYLDGAQVGAALTPPALGGTPSATARYAPLGQTPGGSRQAASVRAPAVAATIAVPPGYRLAWDDDRLNPLRGQGSAQGQARQDEIWTRKVPATAVAEAQPPAAQGNSRLTVSTKGQPQAAVDTRPAARSFYVQVGAFGDPANAQGSTARLQAAGLPVAISRARGLQVVMAGPFASQDEAARALSTARSAGFGDAFVR